MTNDQQTSGYLNRDFSMKFKKLKVVVIRWNDACSYDTRHPLDYEFTPKACCTVGLLIEKSDTKIVVARMIEVEEKLLEGAMVIPTRWVKSIKVIGEVTL
jgi:hypothetical protein